MKPKPLSSLNHFTVPVGTAAPSCCARSCESRCTLVSRTTPAWAGPTRTKLPATQVARHGRKLVLAGLARAHRELERVVVVARDHVDVAVEYRLPGGRLAAVEQVHAVAAQAVAHGDGEPLGGHRGVLEGLVVDLGEVAR